MRQKLRYLLQNSDLTEAQIRVYLQLLKLRRATIPQLRDETKLPNITVYRAIRSLVEQELLKQTSLNGKKTYFEPLSLEALAKRMSREQRRLRKLELQLRDLDHLLPYISLDEDIDHEDVLIREGKDAFTEEYLKIPDVLEQEYLHVGNMANMWRVVGFNYESPQERNFIAKRMEKNIYARVLDVHSKEAEQVQRNDSREKRTLMLKEQLPIMENFQIIGERQVSHFICDEDSPRVIVIKQPELVRAHRSAFDALWGAR